VDRRRQEASPQAAAEAEAAVARPAVPDQVVAGVAAVQAAVGAAEAVAEAEAEFSPGLTITPELPHQVARDFTKSLLVSLPLFFGSSHCPP
jgi:hypothetical protein